MPLRFAVTVKQFYVLNMFSYVNNRTCSFLDLTFPVVKKQTGNEQASR